MPLREKGHKSRLEGKRLQFLQSGLRARFTKLRAFQAVFNGIQPNFSAVQTAWPRRKDSNPRYGFAVLSLDVSASCRWQNPTREFHPKTRHQGFAISPVSIRHLFVRERRTSGDSVTKRATLQGSPSSLMGSQVTVCLSRSPKAKNLSAGSAPRKANKWESSEILAHAS